VAIEYVEIKLDDLARDQRVDAAAIKTFYEVHLAEFTIEEQRAANHVLIQVKEGASADDDAAAKRKAEEMRALVLSGKAIEDVAREFSDDIGSRAEGGATGLFGRGVMVPEFEQSVFSMKTGDISVPIRSKFGYHIIKLAEIKPGGIKPLDEVRTEIEERVAREQAQERYYELAERFTDTVLEHPDSLQSAADALELDIQSAIAQSKEQLAASFSPALAETVWESDVLTDGLVSQPVEIGDTRIVAVRVTSFEAAHVPTFEEVKGQVILAMNIDMMREAVIARGKSLLARLEKGEDPATVMTAEKLEWAVVDNATREDERANRAVLRAAFKAVVPEGDARHYLGIEIGNGEYAVAQVGAAKSPPAVDAKPDARLKTELSRLRATANWRDFVAGLKADAKIETNPSSL
jgi:peptidyl-prolyl cis-trans isomerase D